MHFKRLPLDGAYLIDADPFKDERGLFVRAFCKQELKKIWHTKGIAQINHSVTRQKGAIRGMHFQYPPMAEIKMVKCLRGSVFDVIIDLRRNSSTFLKWHGEVLSAENMKMMYVPEGFAHGFQTLEENCELLYLHTEFYNSKYEGAVHLDEPMVGIERHFSVTKVSRRDQTHPYLDESFKGGFL